MNKQISEPIKLSIITPSYNSEAYIQETLESVLKCLPDNAEHIVQDGASSDRTLKILNEYSKKYNLRFFSEKDNNMCEAVNRAYKKSNGEILCFLSADNLLIEGAIEAALEFFTNNPDEHFVYGHTIHIDAKGEVLYDHWDAPFLQHLSSKISSISKNLNHEALLNIHPGILVSDGAYFVRKNLIDEWGYFFDEKFPIVMDYEFWLRISKRSKLNYIKNNMVYFRVHEDQITAGNQKNAWFEILKINHMYGGSFFNGLHKKFVIEALKSTFRKIWRWR